MKLEATLCNSQLLSMLLQPELFHRAVSKYEATSPDMQGEGFNGYMEVKATFYIKNLAEFNNLWEKSYKLPSDRCDWYHKVKSATLA